METKKYPYKGRVYRGLENISYIEPAALDVRASIPADAAAEALYDMIFATDLRTGFPTGAISMHLSEKTADDVRTFIEQKIMIEHGDQRGLVPVEMLKRGSLLDDEFIAQTVRQRFESDEQYEARLSGYMSKIQEQEQFKSRLAEYQKKLGTTKSKESE